MAQDKRLAEAEAGRPRARRGLTRERRTARDVVMLQPTKTKFRKAHKGRIHGIATSAARTWPSASTA